jgi:predicted Zn-dependent peptidase
MVLILTGNFSGKTCKKALEEFGNKPAGETLSKKSYSIESAKPKPIDVTKKAGLTQTYLSIGARTVFSSHKDVPALDLISAILSGGAGSRLFIELREKNAFTYDVQSDHNEGLDWGYFNVNCAVKNKNFDKAKTLIFKELLKLRTEKVPADEIQRSKNLITAEILRAIDNPQQSSDVLAYMEIQFKSEKSLADYINHLKSVTGENILEAANTYLQEDSFSTILLTPKK